MFTSMLRPCMAGLVCLALLAPSVRSDELEDVRARLKIEAQRVERAFTEGRAEAYRLVRSDNPRLSDAVERLESLLAMVRDDASLERSRRELLQRTLRFDLDKVRDIAAERRRLSARPLPPPARREDARPTTPPRAVADDRRGSVRDVRDIIDGRKRLLADTRDARLDAADRRVRVLEDVTRSSVPETEDYKFPKNWKELSEKRSAGVKMTDVEKAIMKSLNTSIAVEYEGEKFEDVVDHLRKVTGLPISVDKRSLEEANVTYETPVKLKMKATARTVLKRIFAEMNLSYVIKEETVLVLTRERASRETVTRSYYLGDLVGVVGMGIDPITSQLVMLERANQLINLITQKVDRNSWQLNNPDAAGQITFHPATMSLIVKQTAEWHFMNGSR